MVIELAGLDGSEVLSFGAGTSLSQLVTGINLVKDATGVEAVAAGTTLQLRSSEYGSAALVDLKVISQSNHVIDIHLDLVRTGRFLRPSVSSGIQCNDLEFAGQNRNLVVPHS